jgi:uncharacterized protein YcfJ
MKVFTGLLATATAVVLASSLSGCGTTSSAVTGAGVGALGGYVAGRGTGDHSDKRARHGAILGALGGYVVGNEMDKRNNTNNYQPHQHQGGHNYHTHRNGVSHSH